MEAGIILGNFVGKIILIAFLIFIVKLCLQAVAQDGWNKLKEYLGQFFK